MKLPDKVVYSPPSLPFSLSSSGLAPPPSSGLPSLSSSSPPQAQPDHNLSPSPPASDSSPAVSPPPPPPLPDSAANSSSSPPPSCPLPDAYYSPPESVVPPSPPPESPPPPDLESPPPPDLDSPPLATFYPSPPPPSLPLSPPPPPSVSPPPPASQSPPSSFFYASPPPPASSSPPPPTLPPPGPLTPELAHSPPPQTLSPPVPKSPPPRAHPPPQETPSPPSNSPPPSHKSHPTSYVPPPKVHKSPPSLPSAVKPSSRNSSPQDPQKVLGVTTSTAVTVAVVSGLVMLTFLGAAAWFVKKNKKTFEPSGQVGSGSAAAVTGSSQSHLSGSTYPRSPSHPLARHTSGSYARYTSGSYGFPYSPSEAGLGIMKLWFTLEDLSVFTNGFSSQNLLGEGGFGPVYKGCLPDGRLVAVKQLKIGGKQGEREFQAEVETISRVHHRHLVSLVGYCISENQRLLVYDYVPNNTLYYHLHEKASPGMGWTTRVKIAAGSARGIAYLHEDCHPRVMHRDIKSSNILLDNNFEAQVSDFGLARSPLDSNTHVTTRVMGTFGYLAPEYASSGKLTAKSDVYSFGVVLLELITGRKPVDSSRPLGDESLVEWARPLLIQALETGDLGVLPDPRLEGNYMEEEMLRMIETAAACVRHSATMRPRMGQVVRVLDGLAESNDITNGIRPGQSEIFESSPQTEEIRIFQRREFGFLDESSSDYSRSSWKRRTNL